MDENRIDELLAFHRDDLLVRTIPWWQSRMLDREDGGYLFYRDRDGSLLSTDKPMWTHGRAAWMWSRLYNTVEPRDDWLGVARHGIDFILKHGFDTDGRMFFRVTKEGRPLIKRRYLFTECFGVIAFAEFARATGSEEMLERASDLYGLVLKYHTTPGLLPPKVIPATRALKGHSMPMILVSISQILREAGGDEGACNATIEWAAEEVLGTFVQRERRCLLETVLADGSILDTPEGRTVNPGHAIETSWFLMEEARHRGDECALDEALEVLGWSLDIGWDPEFGGILYFVDCDGRQAEPYEHDMKLWWPHTEALYACLLAHHLTGDAVWADWYERVHAWTYSHFPDEHQGEWFGYLHRDGSLSSTVKGNLWKGPFHLPRMQLYAWKLLAATRSA